MTEISPQGSQTSEFNLDAFLDSFDENGDGEPDFSILGGVDAAVVDLIAQNQARAVETENERVVPLEISVPTGIDLANPTFEALRVQTLIPENAEMPRRNLLVVGMPERYPYLFDLYGYTEEERVPTALWLQPDDHDAKKVEEQFLNEFGNLTTHYARHHIRDLLLEHANEYDRLGVQAIHAAQLQFGEMLDSAFRHAERPTGVRFWIDPATRSIVGVVSDPHPELVPSTKEISLKAFTMTVDPKNADNIPESEMVAGDMDRKGQGRGLQITKGQATEYGYWIGGRRLPEIITGAGNLTDSEPSPDLPADEKHVWFRMSFDYRDAD